MNATTHDQLVDRIAEAVWGIVLGETAVIEVADVELLLRAHQAERALSDSLYEALIGKASGPEMAKAIRIYGATRMTW